MIHAGATVVDSLPHGSFFHATGRAVGMDIERRMKLIPYEAMIGLTSTAVSVIMYLVLYTNLSKHKLYNPRQFIRLILTGKLGDYRESELY